MSIGGLMGQIAQGGLADIVGAQNYREQKLADDERKRREIRARQLMGKNFQSIYGLEKDSPAFQLAETDPEGFIFVMGQAGIKSDEDLKRTAADVQRWSAMNDRQFAEDIQQQLQAGQASGYTPRHIQMLANTTMKDGLPVARRTVSTMMDTLGHMGIVGSTRTAGEREFESLTKGFSDEEKIEAQRIKAGLAPRAQGSSNITIAKDGLTDLVADSEAQIAGAKKSSETTAQGNANRSQDFINRGVAAAESIPVLRRSLSLLDSVKTGGFSNALLGAKKMFGVEGADEGELSANLGRAVLSQLRETFGAAFTENEGARLEKIEASFGKNTETNRRLIEQMLTIAEKKANRGLEAAREAGDDFTVSDIEKYISLSLDPEPEKHPDVPSLPSGVKFLGFE